MDNIKKYKIYIELLVTCLIVLILDIVFKDNIGFYKNNYIFYLLIPFIFTLLYGKGSIIILSLISTSLTLFLSIVIYYNFFFPSKDLNILKSHFSNLPVSLSITIFIIYITLILVKRYTLKIDKLTKRVKKLSVESLNYKRSTKALEIVNIEYESQISRSQNSITDLYNEIKKLNKLNTKYILKTFLQTIQQFTHIKKAQIWKYDEVNLNLLLVSSIGYSTPNLTQLDIKNTVEGYVYRNNQFFTIRKRVYFQTVISNNIERNIMTFPINIGKKVWGVLNIEDIAFEKYSIHCEKLIQIIINLTEPSLEKAIEYELMVKQKELDQSTGLPLYGQFYSILEDKLENSNKNGNSLSVIIFELTNIDELCKTHIFSDIMKFFSNTIIEIFNNNIHDFLFFKYKETNQIALLSSTLDQDGISFYLIKIFKILNESVYNLDEVKVTFNLSIGYATQSNQINSTETLLLEAENLLHMSKL